MHAQLIDHQRSMIRGALTWGRAQAGEGEAAELAYRAAALVLATDSPIPDILPLATRLAQQAAEAHFAFAALATIISGLRRVGDE